MKRIKQTNSNQNHVINEQKKRNKFLQQKLGQAKKSAALAQKEVEIEKSLKACAWEQNDKMKDRTH